MRKQVARLALAMLLTAMSAGASAQDVRYSWFDIGFGGQDVGKDGSLTDAGLGQTVDVSASDGNGIRFRGSVGTWKPRSYECDWAPGPIPWSATINSPAVPLPPWEDPAVRNLIDEWLRQTENCTRRVHPASYIDRWGRICGRLQTMTADCSQDPDHPPDWDNYRYLWEHNWCPDYFSYRVRDYVRRRQQGASASQLLVCKPGRDVPCR